MDRELPEATFVGSCRVALMPVIKRYRQGEFEFTFVSPSSDSKEYYRNKNYHQPIYVYEIQKVNIAKTQHIW